MKRSDHVVVFITATGEEAYRLAELLVKQRKAACVNAIPSIHSIYWWRGEVESSDESLLVIKSRASTVDDLVSLVKANHSYEVPEVVVLPIVAGNNDYLAWIDEVLQ